MIDKAEPHLIIAPLMCQIHKLKEGLNRPTCCVHAAKLCYRILNKKCLHGQVGCLQQRAAWRIAVKSQLWIIWHWCLTHTLKSQRAAYSAIIQEASTKESRPAVYTFVTFNMTVALMADAFIWQNPQVFCDIKVSMGGFHLVLIHGKNEVYIVDLRRFC